MWKLPAILLLSALIAGPAALAYRSPQPPPRQAPAPVAPGWYLVTTGPNYTYPPPAAGNAPALPRKWLMSSQELDKGGARDGYVTVLGGPYANFEAARAQSGLWP